MIQLIGLIVGIYAFVRLIDMTDDQNRGTPIRVVAGIAAVATLLLTVALLFTGVETPQL